MPTFLNREGKNTVAYTVYVIFDYNCTDSSIRPIDMPMHYDNDNNNNK